MTPEKLAHNAWLYFVGYPLFGVMLAFILVRDAADWVVERVADLVVWTAGDYGAELRANLYCDDDEKDKDCAREP